MRARANEGEDGLEIIEARHIGPVRRLHHDHRQAKTARRRDFGIGRFAAAVLADEHIDLLAPHEIDFVVEAKGPARQNQTMVRQPRPRLRRIDAADEIIMRRRRFESRKLLASNRQKDLPRIFAESLRGGAGGFDLGPAIAFDRLPWRPAEQNEPNPRRAASSFRMRGHLLGKRMRRIDDEIGLRVAQISDQAVNAAETADTKSNRRKLRRQRAAGERQNRRDITFASQCFGEMPRFGRSAEDQYTQSVRHLVRLWL